MTSINAWTTGARTRGRHAGRRWRTHGRSHPVCKTPAPIFHEPSRAAIPRRHPRLPDAEKHRAFYAAKNPGIGVRDCFATSAEASTRRAHRNRLVYPISNDNMARHPDGTADEAASHRKADARKVAPRARPSPASRPRGGAAKPRGTRKQTRARPRCAPGVPRLLSGPTGNRQAARLPDGWRAPQARGDFIRRKRGETHAPDGHLPRAGGRPKRIARGGPP
jgi:hypothetical protein